MSDHDHDHEHERGGHEIDKLPNARLFNLLFGLSLLVLLSSIGVIQLFNLQVRSIEASRAKQPSFRLLEYREGVNALLSGHHTVTVVDEGGVERTAHTIPVAEAKKAVLDDAGLLGAAPKYRGWEKSGVAQTIKTLEDAHKGGMPPRMPEPQEPEEPAGEPEPDEDAEPADEDAEPTDDGSPVEEEEEEEAPAEKPAPKAPAEKPAPKAPAEKPAPKAPAEKPAPKTPAEKPAPKPQPADDDGE